MIKTICFVCGVTGAIFSTVAYADLPLTVEDLITDKGKVKIEISLTYANSNSQGIFMGEPVMVQTGPTSFVTLPIVIGERQGNRDSVVSTLGLRYGLTAKAEIFTRASYLYTDSRSSDVSGITSNSEGRFADAWVGVNYQLKKDDDTAAVLGFMEVALREKHRKNSSSFKSVLIGLTTYRAIDPVVFSLTTAYRFNQSRKDGDTDYKPGNLLLLNPSVAFAANDRVTLTMGLQWTNHHADKIDGKVQDFRRTNTDLLLGVGYGIMKGSLLNFTFKTNTSGSNGAELRLNWLHTL